MRRTILAALIGLGVAAAVSAGAQERQPAPDTPPAEFRPMPLAPPQESPAPTLEEAARTVKTTYRDKTVRAIPGANPTQKREATAATNRKPRAGGAGAKHHRHAGRNRGRGLLRGVSSTLNNIGRLRGLR